MKSVPFAVLTVPISTIMAVWGRPSAAINGMGQEPQRVSGWAGGSHGKWPAGLGIKQAWQGQPLARGRGPRPLRPEAGVLGEGRRARRQPRAGL